MHELIGTTTGVILHDNTWNAEGFKAGVYSWYVVAIYENGNLSDPIYSNTLDSDMITTVDVEITTEYAGDDPTAIVTFTNTSESDLDLVYTHTLNATGLYTFTDFRKGTYTFKVELDGYTTINESNSSVWNEPTEFVRELLGDYAPPVNLTVVDDEIYYETNVVLNWETGASSEFHGYNVYRGTTDRDLVLLNDTPLTETTYTDTVTLGHGDYEYFVRAVYTGVESVNSNAASIQVIEKGGLTGTITDALAAAVKIEGATITYDGVDEFGIAWDGVFTSDELGKYGGTYTIWPGTYNLTVVADGYVDAAAEAVVIDNDALTTIDFAMVEIPYAVSNVVATVVGDSIEVTWAANVNRAFDEYNLYRKANLQEGSLFEVDELIGTTTGLVLHDNAWDAEDFKAGVYSWYVVAVYDAGNLSDPIYSNTLDKDMLTEVNVEVTTEFGDDPTAIVTFTNTSESDLELVYTDTLDATGLYTFTDFRKGTYTYEVELDGYVDINLAGNSIWDETDYEWVMGGAAPAPQNLVAVNDSIYMGIDDVKLSWEAPASSEFAGYIVYRNGVELFDIPIAELSYTDVAPPYAMSPAHAYTVKAFYLSGTESDFTDAIDVYVTGLGLVDGEVFDAREDELIEGAQVKLVGLDEFGAPQTYVFITDEDGVYENDSVWAGVYDYAVTYPDFDVVEQDDVVVEYNETTTEDFYLFPAMEVIATENADQDEVLVEWEFAVDASRELINFTIYRAIYDEYVYEYTLLGTTLSNNFIDTDWGIVESGVYKWAVETTYDDGMTVSYSNTLDKDMEVAVGLTVALNSAESPEGVNVFLNNISEPLLELSYDIDLDATGITTVDPFRKGVYDIKVSFFGYEIQIISDVLIESDTAFSYVLEELITEVGNLYVDPNGYATWEMPTEGGLDEYSTDFTGGIPSSITVVEGPGTKHWAAANHFVKGDIAENGWGYNIDSRMNTPKIALTDNTVFEFAWSGSYTWNVAPFDNGDLTVEISLDEGLTWESIWSFSDIDPWNDFEWYVTTLDVAAMGYDSGEAMFSVHMVGNDNGDVYVDDLYIGDAVATAGTVSISSTPEANTNELRSGERVMVDILANNSLAANRSLTTFKVTLDDVFSGNTTDEFYDYEVAETLVEGTEYTAKVEALYTTGTSDPMFYTFTYHTCTYYNAAADFTAIRVEGAMNIELAWTNDTTDVDVDVFVGTSVYRDGEFVALVARGTESFIDEAVASGDYTYCVTQVYFSEAESCEICDDVTMTPGGYVNGFVTMFDGGNAIEGATVSLVGATNSYTFTTDTLGFYTGEVFEGTYNYTVSATEFATTTLDSVVIDFGATVVKDFLLKEFPYTVGTVIATEMNDNTVQVDWSGTGGGGGSIEEWLRYDDGTNEDAIGGVATFSWATKYDPAQLADLAGASVTKIQIYNTTDAVNKLQIFEGTNAATIIYEQDLTGLTVDAWNEVVFNYCCSN